MDISKDKRPERPAGLDPHQIMVKESIALLRKAEQPGHSVDEFVRARNMGYETIIPQVQLVALHSSDRSIKMQAWLNLNLDGDVLKFVTARLENENAEIKKLAADALRLHDYTIQASARLTAEQEQKIKEKARLHHQHDNHQSLGVGMEKVDHGATAKSIAGPERQTSISTIPVPTTLITGASAGAGLNIRT